MTYPLALAKYQVTSSDRHLPKGHAGSDAYPGACTATDTWAFGRKLLEGTLEAMRTQVHREYHRGL